jgi:hypothetical protein
MCVQVSFCKDGPAPFRTGSGAVSTGYKNGLLGSLLIVYPYPVLKSQTMLGLLQMSQVVFFKKNLLPQTAHTLVFFANFKSHFRSNAMDTDIKFPVNKSSVTGS